MQNKWDESSQAMLPFSSNSLSFSERQQFSILGNCPSIEVLVSHGRVKSRIFPTFTRAVLSWGGPNLASSNYRFTRANGLWSGTPKAKSRRVKEKEALAQEIPTRGSRIHGGAYLGEVALKFCAFLNPFSISFNQFRYPKQSTRFLNCLSPTSESRIRRSPRHSVPERGDRPTAPYPKNTEKARGEIRKLKTLKRKKRRTEQRYLCRKSKIKTDMAIVNFFSYFNKS
ncbi:hypothetical protein H6P81_011907 [Aristolochia fimbriata]|uniref:Uncharacterized protein n=1 Tax=Aristolochia fimbriata TaxID=158543 RepID=A0AAV7EBZ5_ARIFI|nr:hypothetical protein H6P81_011907 [Aristolochia fimbriata]